jgi:hypothetical protein
MRACCLHLGVCLRSLLGCRDLATRANAADRLNLINNLLALCLPPFPHAAARLPITAQLFLALIPLIARHCIHLFAAAPLLHHCARAPPLRHRALAICRLYLAVCLLRAVRRDNFTCRTFLAVLKLDRSTNLRHSRPYTSHNSLSRRLFLSSSCLSL